MENATNGHITNFLENIHHDVVVMLMNAMYFKGETFRQRLLSMPTSTVVIVKKKTCVLSPSLADSGATVFVFVPSRRRFFTGYS